MWCRLPLFLRSIPAAFPAHLPDSAALAENVTLLLWALTWATCILRLVLLPATMRRLFLRTSDALSSGLFPNVGPRVYSLWKARLPPRVTD